MLHYRLLPCSSSCNDKNAPPIIALHGMLKDGASLEPFCSRLTDVVSVYLVDLPSHGLSPPARPLNILQMAKMLNSFISSLSLQRCWVFGHSLGGQVGMQAALNDKEKKIAGVFALDISPINYFLQPGPLPEVVGDMNIVDIMSMLMRTDDKSLKTKEEAITRIMELNAKINPTEAESLLYLLKEKKGGGAPYMEWAMDIHALRESLENKQLCWETSTETKPFEGILMLLRGSKSSWVSEENHKKPIEALFPFNKVITIQGAGHSPHIDDPETVERLVKETLKESISNKQQDL